MAHIRNDDLSLNIAEKDVSIMVTESASVIYLDVFPCMWGEAMFGEVCILGSPVNNGGSNAYMLQWGDAAFGESGILGVEGNPSTLRTFRQLNIIRTN